MTAKPTTCAVCKKALAPDAAEKSPLYPFCCQRCKEIDLLRWCKGEYAVVNDMDPDALLEMEEERRARQGEGEF